MSDLNVQEQIRARKRHKCDLCGKAILPGEEYIRQKWFDGRFQTAARHIHCDAVLDGVLRLNGEWDEYDPDEIREDVRGYVCEACPCYGDDCENDPFACEITLEKLVIPSCLGAAKESARRVLELEA